MSKASPPQAGGSTPSERCSAQATPRQSPPPVQSSSHAPAAPSLTLPAPYPPSIRSVTSEEDRNLFHLHALNSADFGTGTDSLYKAISQLLKDASTVPNVTGLLQEVKALAPSQRSQSGLRAGSDGSRRYSQQYAGSIPKTPEQVSFQKRLSTASSVFLSRSPAIQYQLKEQLQHGRQSSEFGPAGFGSPVIAPETRLPESRLASTDDAHPGDDLNFLAAPRDPGTTSSGVSDAGGTRLVSALSDFVPVDRITAAAINLHHNTDSGSEEGEDEDIDFIDSSRSHHGDHTGANEGGPAPIHPVEATVEPQLGDSGGSGASGKKLGELTVPAHRHSFESRDSLTGAQNASRRHSTLQVGSDPWKRFATSLRKRGLLEHPSCSYLQRLPGNRSMRRQSLLHHLISRQADRQGKYVKWGPSMELALTSCAESEVVEAMQIIAAALALRDKFQSPPDDIDSPCVSPSPYKIGEGSTEPLFHPFSVTPPTRCEEADYTIEAGVYKVYWKSPYEQDIGGSSNHPPLTNVPSVSVFLQALREIMAAVQHPACKTFTFRRLEYLQHHFAQHVMFNAHAELEETQENKHRDFYNVRKVDTHVHHSACMHQKHLLRYIRKKCKTEPDSIVARTSTGEPVTLSEIFEKEVGMNAWEASTDLLNVHALGSCFHRFDIFNSKYNPFGQPLLREVFLKTDNILGGQYLAEITKEVITDLEEAKYQYVEWRLSIYGRRRDEWAKLARWVRRFNLSSKQVRYMIQVPRLFHVYRNLGLVRSFQDLLSNVFEPLFEAVKDPAAHEDIYYLLLQLNGWDSVDDESVVSKYTAEGGALPCPEDWTEATNPPYSYWAYYMYANITTLNGFLAARGMRTLPFRPHCGETGSVSHCASMYLLAHGINHGIMLKKSPVLQYLYYLSQIGLAVSPLSNNALFHGLDRHPFWRFFQIGLNISLSTDDPLMFHFTTEPLLEEYSCCAVSRPFNLTRPPFQLPPHLLQHQWKMSPVDLCEIARNSVYQSHFEPQYKRHWIGENYASGGSKGNCIARTNLSDIRVHYREDTLFNEVRYIRDVLQINELINVLTVPA